MHACVVVSLLTGARTEELRALTWRHLDLEGDLNGMPPKPLSIQLWPFLRAGGETKTKRSRRTLELPELCIDALREHRCSGRLGGFGVDTPRELRHRFVALLSSSGVPIEDIAHLVDHASTNVTEKGYRKELQPVLSLERRQWMRCSAVPSNWSVRLESCGRRGADRVWPTGQPIQRQRGQKCA
jgi:integrase